MQVKLEKQYAVAASPNAAWQVLRDIRQLAACMPGAEITGQIDDTHYKGNVKVKVGPASAAFGGEIEILALQLKVFHTLVRLFLLTHIISQAPWLTASSAD